MGAPSTAQSRQRFGEAPEAIIADTGFESQMQCRSELAMLCTRAMYGACFYTLHSLPMIRSSARSYLVT